MSRFFPLPALPIVAGLLTQTYMVVAYSLPAWWLLVGLAPYVVCSVVAGHIGKLHGLFCTGACFVTDLVVISANRSGKTAVELGLATLGLPLLEIFVSVPVGYAVALIFQKCVVDRSLR
jgi:hypothetical protein